MAASIGIIGNPSAPLELADRHSGEASNLATALRLLPRDRAEAMMVFYRFCRIVDDIADHPALTSEVRLEWLDHWEDAVRTRCGIPPELAEVFDRYRIDPDYPLALIEGCRSDVLARPTPDLGALEKYCWNVACSVGLVSIDLFGCRSPESRQFAIELGHALQLTNILRDVHEDALRARIYLPADLLDQYDVSPQSLMLGNPDPGFLGVAKHLHNLSRDRYRAARALITDTDRTALRPARLMMETYSHLLAKMKSDRFQVFRKSYRLSKWKKVALAARVLMRG